MSCMPYKFEYGNKIIEIPKVSELLSKNDITWANVLNKPNTFNPSTHSHSWGSITGKPSSMPANGGTATNANNLTNVFFKTSGGEWMGVYNSSGTRLGWIGFNGSNYLKVTNDLARGSSGIMLCAGDTAGVCLDYTSTSSNYHGYFFPRYAGKVTLGSSGYRWYRLYAANSCDTSSDRRLKKDISYFNEIATFSDDGNIYEKLFRSLKPASFTMKSDETNSLRFGFIAQDIEESLNELGLSVEDVDFISYGMRDEDAKSDNLEEKTHTPYMYGLCYEQFIALNTYMIQKAHNKIDEQQKEIDALKDQVQKLMDLVNL